MLGSVIGVILTILLDKYGSGSLGSALLSMAVFGATFSYVPHPAIWGWFVSDAETESAQMAGGGGERRR